MSTRCTINFVWNEIVVAKVYRHCDGYPDGKQGVPADLDLFFANVEVQCHDDTRFNDPAYLAARFIVWQAGQNAQDERQPLNFLSLGVMQKDPSDIEYTYDVACMNDMRPVVRCWKMRLGAVRGEEIPLPVVQGQEEES